MILKQPKKYCKCGRLIPANGEVGFYGQAKLPQLVCEACARDAAPPKPKVRKWQPGDQHPDQIKIDVPKIRID